MEGYIDFHAHILPGADHGSDGMETSLKQLELAERAGISTIVMTPHFYPDVSGSEAFFDRRAKAAAALRAAYNGPIRLLVGAEVFLCEGLQNHPRLRELCVENTKVLLAEMPNPPWPRRFAETLESVEAEGYGVILAHVDRYPVRDVEGLIYSGFKAQINADALRKPHRRLLVSWIEKGYVIALGSDIHGLSAAYRDYERALAFLGGGREIIEASMAALLTDKSGGR